MEVTLGMRTEETAALYFQKANTPEIKKYLPQRVATLEEFLADFRASQAPGPPATAGPSGWTGNMRGTCGATASPPERCPGPW